MVFQLATIAFMFPVVVVAYAANAGIGVGAALVAVTVGSNVLPVRELLPVILPLSIITTGYLAYRERRHIARSLLLRQIIPSMSIGLLMGLACLNLLNGVNLKVPLGVAVVLMSGWQLIGLFRESGKMTAMPPMKARFLLLLAGVVHAVYTTGGPLLAYSVSRSEMSKSAFRATMCMVLVAMNSALVLAFLWRGRFSAGTIETTLPLILALPLGIRIGEWFHRRFSERTFKVITYSILIGSGVSLIVSSALA